MLQLRKGNRDNLGIILLIFSLAVFEENLKVMSKPWGRRLTEDIYLKLLNSCSLSKGEPIPVGEVILQFFLTKLCPFFDLEFSKCSYSRALAPACGALVPFKHTL